MSETHAHCLLCRSARGWLVAYFFMGQWMSRWKPCPHCQPKQEASK
jgi:hypothetical protein